MSEDLAREREEYANTLSQDDIWHAVVLNAIKMDASADMKAEILLGAINDIAITYRLLKQYYKKGTLDNESYQNLLHIIIDKIEERKKDVDFNPILMNEDE